MTNWMHVNTTNTMAHDDDYGDNDDVVKNPLGFYKGSPVALSSGCTIILVGVYKSEFRCNRLTYKFY